MTKRSDRRCYECKYRTSYKKNGTDFYCEYIFHTGHRRGCPPGEECEKFEQRKILIGGSNEASGM